MGRIKRFKVEGVPQLVSQRGHNQLPCFTDGSDYKAFDELLHASAKTYKCRIRALLMLPDGYWAVIDPATEDGVSKTIQRTGRLYVRQINNKYRRSGTLWAQRYQACPVDPSVPYLSSVDAYLDSLPATRGYAAEDWPWKRSDLPKRVRHAASAEQVNSALRSGTALGSSDFIRQLETKTGLRATPAKRGRPRQP